MQVVVADGPGASKDGAAPNEPSLLSPTDRYKIYFSILVVIISIALSAVNYVKWSTFGQSFETTVSNWNTVPIKDIALQSSACSTGWTEVSSTQYPGFSPSCACPTSGSSTVKTSIGQTCTSENVTNGCYSYGYSNTISPSTSTMSAWRDNNGSPLRLCVQRYSDPANQFAAANRVRSKNGVCPQFAKDGTTALIACGVPTPTPLTGQTGNATIEVFCAPTSQGCPIFSAGVYASQQPGMTCTSFPSMLPVYSGPSSAPDGETKPTGAQYPSTGSAFYQGFVQSATTLYICKVR